MAELRWHPLREEWVITANHRQERTFLPPADYCPLCPTRLSHSPTEIPAASYEIVVFENRFPALRSTPPEPAVEGSDLFRVAPAEGVCEVVCYTPQHDTCLGDLPIEQIHRLIRVWTDRYRELGDRPELRYVYIFENRGEAIGVTLSHPHGQIYAFPYVPPIIAQEIASSERHFQATGRCLLCDIAQAEQADGRRVVVQGDHFLAIVPFYARWAYELHIIARAHRGSLVDLPWAEQRDLARVLKTVLQKLDRLFGFPLPYILAMHQRPTDGGHYVSYHFHLEIYPPHRTASKLKYLAGCESGAGSFITDTLPEEKAAELRAVAIED